MPGFLDLTETQLISFAQNFSIKLAVHDPVLTSITPADVTIANLSASNMFTAINTVNNIRNDAQEYTNVKNIILYSPLGTAYPTPPTATAWPISVVGSIAGMIAWYRVMAARIKADAGYTVAIGQDLGIIGTADDVDENPPVLGGFALTGYNNEINWAKAGHDGIRFRSQRGAETQWTEIGTDIFPPFIDNRPPLTAGPPEERRYQAAYVDNDAVSTSWSATLTIIAHS